MDIPWEYPITTTNGAKAKNSTNFPSFFYSPQQFLQNFFLLRKKNVKNTGTKMLFTSKDSRWCSIYLILVVFRASVLDFISKSLADNSVIRTSPWSITALRIETRLTLGLGSTISHISNGYKVQIFSIRIHWVHTAVERIKGCSTCGSPNHSFDVYIYEYVWYRRLIGVPGISLLHMLHT